MAWSNPAFSFNVAQLQRELGLCAEARENYRAFLDNERDAERRKQAELALEELARCVPRRLEPPAAESCTAWETEVVQNSARRAESGNASARAGVPQAAALTQAPIAPAAVALAEARPDSPSLIAVTSEPTPNAKRSVRKYLPWIFAGVGVVCTAASAYEFAQMTSAQHAAPDEMTDLASLNAEGRKAEALSWVFAGGAVLSLGAALVLVLTESDDPPPSAARR